MVHPSTTTPQVEIRRSLELIHRPGNVFEIRVLDACGRPKAVDAGYFDDLDAAAAAAAGADSAGCSGVYVTVNPVLTALLARANNRLVPRPKNTTADSEILRRHWLLLDIDSNRPPGIAATDHEHQAASSLAADIEDILRSHGFSYPLICDSGNGCYLLYRVDLPDDPDVTATIRRFYLGLETLLASEYQAHIDTGIFNPARIIRVGGTTNRKGDSTPDRPHRRCEYHEPIEECPVEPIPLGLIQGIADLAPRPEQPAARARANTFGLRIPGVLPSNHGPRLDVPRYLQARGVEYRTKVVGDGVAYLVTCPFGANHGASGESAMFQTDTGLLTYECKHNSCQGRRWADYRDAIGRPDPDHYDPPLNSRLATGQATEQQQTTSPDTKRAKRIQFARISSAELDGTNYELTYLVDDILVDQQPCLMAGPHKSLKTNLLVDLSVALAIGGKFLGVFNVREPVRVGVMSGESGLATLQETGRRIAQAAGTRLAEIDNLIWTPDLPVLGHPDYMEALENFIRADSLRVIAIDPAYLATPLAADKGNNLFAIGELLRSVNDVCQECGCTLLIAHHMKKTGISYDPPELSDAAWSGWAEWCRQWLLLNRREKFDPDGNGEHRLWFAAGGSAGHFGLWGLDIEEGRRDAPEGRCWDVVVRPASDVRAEAKDDRQVERRRDESAKFEKDLDAVAEALDAHPDGATRTRLREHCGMSGAKFGKAIAELEKRKIAERCQVQVSNHKKPTEGYRRVPDTADSPT